MLTIKYYSYRDSTRKLLPTYSDQLPNTHHTLQRPSSTQVLLMLSLTALKNSIHQSRKPPLLLSHALPSTTMSLPRLVISNSNPSVWFCGVSLSCAGRFHCNHQASGSCPRGTDARIDFPDEPCGKSIL